MLESLDRNTAPALILAALHAREQDAESNASSSDPILVITLADETIQNGNAFTKVLQDCFNAVSSDDSAKTIAILDIKSAALVKGYGYIKNGGDQGTHGEFTVEQFAENQIPKSFNPIYITAIISRAAACLLCVRALC